MAKICCQIDFPKFPVSLQCCLPPMAAVSVTPMIMESALVAPKQLRPAALLEEAR